MLHRAIGHIPTNFTFSRGWANLAILRLIEAQRLIQRRLQAMQLRQASVQIALNLIQQARKDTILIDAIVLPLTEN